MVMWSLRGEVPFLRMIFPGSVPMCLARSFLKSPIVSSGSHLTRTFLPRRSLLSNSVSRGEKKGRDDGEDGPDDFDHVFVVIMAGDCA